MVKGKILETAAPQLAYTIDYIRIAPAKACNWVSNILVKLNWYGLITIKGGASACSYSVRATHIYCCWLLGWTFLE